MARKILIWIIAAVLVASATAIYFFNAETISHVNIGGPASFENENLSYVYGQPINGYSYGSSSRFSIHYGFIYILGNEGPASLLQLRDVVVDFINGISSITFTPNASNSTAVQPTGQNSTHGIFNISNNNSVDISFRMYINYSTAYEPVRMLETFTDLTLWSNKSMISVNQTYNWTQTCLLFQPIVPNNATNPPQPYHAGRIIYDFNRTREYEYKINETDYGLLNWTSSCPQQHTSTMILNSSVTKNLKGLEYVNLSVYPSGAGDNFTIIIKDIANYSKNSSYLLNSSTSWSIVQIYLGSVQAVNRSVDIEYSANVTNCSAIYCLNGYDEDWTTYTRPQSCNTMHVLENFTVNSSANGLNWTVQLMDTYGDLGLAFVKIFNYTAGNWSYLANLSNVSINPAPAKNISFSIPQDSYYNGLFQVHTVLDGGSGLCQTPYYYESSITERIPEVPALNVTNLTSISLNIKNSSTVPSTSKVFWVDNLIAYNTTNTYDFLTVKASCVGNYSTATTIGTTYTPICPIIKENSTMLWLYQDYNNPPAGISYDLYYEAIG